MAQIKHAYPAAGPHARRSFPLSWLAAAAAAAMLGLLAIGAAGSGGLDRLLPNGQPFAPYFTT